MAPTETFREALESGFRIGSRNEETAGVRATYACRVGPSYFVESEAFGGTAGLL